MSNFFLKLKSIFHQKSPDNGRAILMITSRVLRDKERFRGDSWGERGTSKKIPSSPSLKSTVRRNSVGTKNSPLSEKTVIAREFRNRCRMGLSVPVSRRYRGAPSIARARRFLPPPFLSLARTTLLRHLRLKSSAFHSTKQAACSRRKSPVQLR